MRVIIAAYEVLSDVSLRQKYDTKLRQESRENSSSTASSSKKQSQPSYYISYTRTKEECELNLDEWLKEYLDRERHKNESMHKEIIDKYDTRILKILKDELFSNIEFNEDRAGTYFNYYGEEKPSHASVFRKKR